MDDVLSSPSYKNLRSYTCSTETQLRAAELEQDDFNLNRIVCLRGGINKRSGNLWSLHTGLGSEFSKLRLSGKIRFLPTTRNEWLGDPRIVD
jgi:hypothetical protein